MADQDRAAARAVAWAYRLKTEPYSFDFFQALRCIDASHPELPPLGCSGRLAEDPIRLGQDTYMRFAPSTLAEFVGARDGHKPRLAVNFLGLLGPNGPLPVHLTEYTRDRIRNQHDPTFARFLDIFHHRTLTLFYRCWAAAQPTVSLDRPLLDRFGTYVASSFGCGLPSLQGRDTVPDHAKRHFAGLLACQTRHAQGLRAILSGFLQLPVRIEQFVGHWLHVPPAEQWRLGVQARLGVLGESTLVGARVWDYQNCFRVVLGPMPLAAYLRLLPEGESLRRVRDWVRLYVGDSLAWELNLVLQRDEIPQTRLGQSGWLGWTTWLGNAETPTSNVTMLFAKDAVDLVLAAESITESE
jgi:type VI secretion system protein ImpH